MQVRGGELEANMKTSITEGALGAVTKQVLEIMAAEKEREGDEAYDLNATAQELEKQPQIATMENTEGVSEEILEKLRVNSLLL